MLQIPVTDWRNKYMLNLAIAALGVPCYLNGHKQGFAIWEDGPFKKVHIDDRDSLIIIRVNGHSDSTLVNMLPVDISMKGGVLTVKSDSFAKALAALSILRAIDTGLLTEEQVLDEDVFEQWIEAAETDNGARRLVKLVEYTNLPGKKTYQGLQKFTSK